MKKLFSGTALLMIMGAVPGYATISTNLDVTVVPAPSAGPASCSNGGSFGVTVSNSNPSAGSTVSVSFACANGGNYLAWRSTNGVLNVVYPTPTGGAASGTVSMPVPNVASDRSLSWNIELLTAVEGGLVAVSDSSITVPKTYTGILGNALPASVGGDPFVPAHVITVCPSGCNFAHPQDAVAQAQNNGWDNVEITIEAADYQFNNAGGNIQNLFNIQEAPAHVWVKGIIGNSGTDGTVFPRLYGFTSGGAELLRTGGPIQVTFDNLEIGPYNYWAILPDAVSTTFRNVYVHDTDQGLISGDGRHHDIFIYNSHFARNGSGDGPDHNMYIGGGDDTTTFVLKNSISEQVNVGHDVKTRAPTSTLTCDKIMINADNVYNGSSELDCSEGRVCSVHNVLFVQGAGNQNWTFNQSWYTIKYGADRESATLTNNILDTQGSVYIEDVHNPYIFIYLDQRLSPSPPYTASNNKFVWFDSSSMLAGPNNPFQPSIDADGNNTFISSATQGSSTRGATATDITLDGTNHYYPNRSAAGMPAIGTYPLSFNDPSFTGVMPAACADPIGTVRTPAN